MLRVVVQTCDYGAACMANASAHFSTMTFDIEAPSLEAFMREHIDAETKAKAARDAYEAEYGHPANGPYTYWHRHILGVEVLPVREDGGK